MHSRSCPFCGAPLPAGSRASRRYCSDYCRGAAYRLGRACRDVLALLAGTPAAGCSTPAEYVATARALAAASRVGRGKGGLRLAKGHRNGNEARRPAHPSERSNRGVAA